MSDDKGPSYWDVVHLVEGMRDRWGVGIRFLLVPPLYIRSTGKRTSWTISAQCWKLGKAETIDQAAQETFGAGGAWKTMPQALWHALTTLDTRYDDLRAEAQRQHRF